MKAMTNVDPEVVAAAEEVKAAAANLNELLRRAAGLNLAVVMTLGKTTYPGDKFVSSNLRCRVLFDIFGEAE